MLALTSHVARQCPTSRILFHSIAPPSIKSVRSCVIESFVYARTIYLTFIATTATAMATRKKGKSIRWFGQKLIAKLCGMWEGRAGVSDGGRSSIEGGQSQ